MRRQKPQWWGERPILFSHWRGYPLYIFYVYLPAFLGAVAFNQVITRVAWYEWLGAVAAVVILVTAGVYAFYHRYSPAIRSLLAALIAGREIDHELATQAWIETVNYPYVLISRVMLFLTLAYTGQAIYGEKPENVQPLRGWQPHCGGDEWQSGGFGGGSPCASKARSGFFP